MAISDRYRAQVALLVRVMPAVAAQDVFALKGGTAINLFVRDMPRLSVDIDLTYLPVQDRAASLADIDTAMGRIAADIAGQLPKAKVTPQVGSEGAVTRLLVHEGGAQIKIEVTPVTRGCVYPTVRMTLSPAVQEAFGFAEMQVVSLPDLFAGKIVAALDRQHPRDLFDVRDLLRNEGVSPELRRAFLVYMISHNRQLNEVLKFNAKDLTFEYERNFVGMTDESVPLEDLIAARAELHQIMVKRMPDEHRRFLLSFKKGEPDWSLLGVAEAANLPAVRWKIENLNRLPAAKRQSELGRLEEALAVVGG